MKKKIYIFIAFLFLVFFCFSMTRHKNEFSRRHRGPVDGNGCENETTRRRFNKCAINKCYGKITVATKESFVGRKLHAQKDPPNPRILIIVVIIITVRFSSSQLKPLSRLVRLLLLLLLLLLRIRTFEARAPFHICRSEEGLVLRKKIFRIFFFLIPSKNHECYARKSRNPRGIRIDI